MNERIIVDYCTFSFRESFWSLPAAERAVIVTDACKALQACGQSVFFYQVFPARAEYDFLAWITADCTTLEAPDAFLRRLATALTPFRQHVNLPYSLCGITKPSLYIRQRENPQEIDPYGKERDPYFVIYPFSKTAAWYLKSREERQQMMNAHIQLGRSFPEIKQLLLYSFGIQDQEFIVAYEMKDLPMFSDLVQQLRSTEARAYTLLDTPIITGLLRTPAELATLFAGGA